MIIMFLSIELMLNGVNLNLVALSHFMDSVRGQAFTFFIITVAAAEAAIVWASLSPSTAAGAACTSIPSTPQG
jgi:NADH:ubiquinone oxidoreductase subunit K